MEPDASFREAVYELVGQIPPARVMTYGQIAALCGHPRAARQVGQIAHFGPTGLPWHRVVNKQGGLASGYHGGPSVQAQLLEAEGVEVSANGHVAIDQLLWSP